MMTNVLLGAYPGIFAAGSGFVGPDLNAGVYAYWDGACIAGNVTQSPEKWARLITSAYQGYSGWQPEMQLWHGTKDRVLFYANFGEEIR
ncbi:hypothetical protein B0O99DRAFT_720264 [Bisporella sp. PMI_857]|nr:hypothetical protein B0O99DRAFT_720264 [Bisporella sp. PMI_857]